jgi:hypothetical protein
MHEITKPFEHPWLVSSYASKSGIFHITDGSNPQFGGYVTRCNRVIKFDTADVWSDRPLNVRKSRGCRECPRCGTPEDYDAVNEGLRQAEEEKREQIEQRQEERYLTKQRHQEAQLEFLERLGQVLQDELGTAVVGPDRYNRLKFTTITADGDTLRWEVKPDPTWYHSLKEAR